VVHLNRIDEKIGASLVTPPCDISAGCQQVENATECANVQNLCTDTKPHDCSHNSTVAPNTPYSAFDLTNAQVQTT